MDLHDRGALADSILHHVDDVITVVDAGGTVRFVNDGRGRGFGHEPGTSTGRAALSFVHPDDQALALERRTWLLAASGRTTTTVLRISRADGTWRHVETHGVNLVDDPGVNGILYVTRDVEDRARAELALVHALGAQRVVAELGLKALQASDTGVLLREALERVAGLLGAAYVTLLLADGDGRLAVRLQSGAEPLPPGHPWPTEGTQAGATLDGRHPTMVDDLQDRERFLPPPELLDRGVVSAVDVPLEGHDRAIGVLSAATTSPRAFSPVDVQFLQGVANVLAGALTLEKRERTAVVEALHCPLTRLPTRPLLDDRLAHALDRTRRGGGEVALLMIDLDRFKEVNDVWGHAAGDAVLRIVGARLAAAVRSSDTVARYGGDEFVVLCEDEVSHVGVARVAGAIRRACAEPCVLPGGETVLVSASIGTAWSVEEGPDAQALLAAADASMYADKRFGPRS
jgi:diguanylate cyclase (GGDEF)-like protein/PAS domain S-box-containing protein